ncbi:hypothetical protein [Pseudomonas sp. UBA6310]|uniref:hypothetical protein n=1 Tax=Pseudomonas sp. UBA6310 TaxID=1947327 RepID=UPI00257DFF22|nr:hypothetical protein [Pseudomonas sp. UBA6310]
MENTTDLLELIRRAWRLIPSETMIDPAFAEEHSAWHLEASAVLRALEGHPPATARVVMPDLQRLATELCDAVENINDLPPVKYALQAGRAVNKVRDEVARLNASPAEQQTDAARDVLAERQRQIAFELWTPEHDDEHVCDEIAAFASFYAMPPAAREWDATSTGYGLTLGQAIVPAGWQTKTGDRRRELVISGALILAEIERLDRAALSITQQEVKP